jgi:Fe-S-cluster containining protein
MGKRGKGKNDGSGGLAGVPAGGFSEWLRGTEALLRSGDGAADVPCGSCKGCCRSAMFIHIKPDETQTIRRIPRGLLFPAPGLPKGHVLMGYDDKGRCPMLTGNVCSIYEHRPQTCRDYDCRVFAATGVSVDEQAQPEISDRVKAWVFDYESEPSSEEHAILKEAAAFLQKNRDLFPQGTLPSYPVQLAALAVRIHRLFCEMKLQNGGSAAPDAAIAHAIMSLLSEAETEHLSRGGCARAS